MHPEHPLAHPLTPLPSTLRTCRVPPAAGRLVGRAKDLSAEIPHRAEPLDVPRPRSPRRALRRGGRPRTSGDFHLSPSNAVPGSPRYGRGSRRGCAAPTAAAENELRRGPGRPRNAAHLRRSGGPDGAIGSGKAAGMKQAGAGRTSPSSFFIERCENSSKLDRQISE